MRRALYGGGDQIRLVHLVTITPMASSEGRVPCPIGICHGLNSPQSPRMVTIINSGMWQITGSDSMLMQLPTPLDCSSRTPRSPPSHAPASIATPSSSVVSVTTRVSGSASKERIRRLWPASGTIATWRMPASFSTR